MKDFVVITYIAALATTVPLIIISVFTQLKKRSRLVFVYLEFITGILGNIAINAVIFYSLNTHNTLPGGTALRVFNYVTLSLFIHSVPFLITGVLRFRLNKLVRAVFHINGLIALLVFVTNLLFSYISFRLLFIAYVGYLLTLITVSVIAGLFGRKRIENTYIRKAFFLYAALHFLFLPGFILQLAFPPAAFERASGFPGIFSFASVPLFYAAWNIVSLILYFHYLMFGNDKARGGAPVPRIHIPLSGREKEVASLLLEGLSYRRISEKLFISLATVKTHVNNIYKKTDTCSKIQLYNLLIVPRRLRLRKQQDKTGVNRG